MSLLRFSHFTFDTLSLELCVITRSTKTESVALRPKTAELLRELITRRDSVLNKRQLINRIWHCEHVTDQSVFQAVSELRRQLAPLNAIRTFPNRGYQWVLPVTEVKAGHRSACVAIAAIVLLSVLGLASVGGLVSTGQSPQAGSTGQSFSLTESAQRAAPGSSQYQGHHQGFHQGSGTRLEQTANQAENHVTNNAADHEIHQAAHSLPALVAFSEGAAALQRGDTQQALDHLQLSVIERPDFVEARLLLAEAYLLDGDPLQARQRADSVLSSVPSYNSAYATIAAMDLISRADQALGQMNSALEWATRAADQANTSGYECTAADLHDRVLALVKEHDYSSMPLESSPVYATGFARSMLKTAFGRRAGAEDLAQSPLPAGDGDIDVPDAGSSAGLPGRTAAAHRLAHCERYRSGPSGELAPDRSVQQSVADRGSDRVSAKSLI